MTLTNPTRQGWPLDNKLPIQQSNRGFTLTETIIAVAIVGILSSIAAPNYLNQVDRTRQKEAAAIVSQIQTTIAAYADEFGALPTSWADLSEINTISTANGPANTNDFLEILLAGGYYKATTSNTGNQFSIEATRTDKPNLDVYACINLNNGASDIKLESPSGSSGAPICQP